MESVVLVALLLVVIAAVAPSIYALRKRMGAGRKLELWTMLHRRGLSAEAALEEPRPLALALRRCALCPSVEECRHWLAAEAREGFDAFCPNSRYIHRLER